MLDAHDFGEYDLSTVNLSPATKKEKEKEFYRVFIRKPKLIWQKDTKCSVSRASSGNPELIWASVMKGAGKPSVRDDNLTHIAR